MAHTPALPPNRRVEFKKGGWGAAILTTAAAIGAFLTAFYIHTQTYRHPRDAMMRQMGSAPAHGAAAEHGAAKGGDEGHGAAPATGGEHGAAPAAGATTAPAAKAAH